MFDFGSILGSGTVYAQRHRPGNEYMFEQKPGWLTLATLGLYVRPWMTIDYPRVPRSVGRLDAERFDPLMWKPEYPNPAFDNMRPDDAFWAARIVSQFSDEAIRAVVEKAAYSDPTATDFMRGSKAFRSRSRHPIETSGAASLASDAVQKAAADDSAENDQHLRPTTALRWRSLSSLAFSAQHRSARAFGRPPDERRHAPSCGNARK
jgi:hypothetical protein